MTSRLLTCTSTLFAALALAASAHAQTPAADPALIEKGKALFADTAFSASGQTSCATCHPANGHTDNKTYVGLDVVTDGDPRGRSTPTLWGAGERSKYSWAGTAPNMEANIRGIIVNRMKGPEPTPEALGALAAYVRSLKAPVHPELDADGAPKRTASDAIKRGFDLFIGDGGCGTCHVMPTFDKAELEDVGSGGTFKVPSLRAVSKTAPYYHNGRYKTLAETTAAMWDHYQKKQNTGKPAATPAQIADLVAYLEAL
jgi:cytochrome c peroxidase